MIRIYPTIEQKFTCPICGLEIEANKTIWQGIHVGVESECTNCQRTFYQDLKVGHSMYTPYSVDIRDFKLFGSENSKDWYGVPLQKSLKYVNKSNIEFKKVKYEHHDKVLILNCIDYLYGHTLLKLLNAERHLKDNLEYGLIVVVPKFLEWMLPKGIAEKWVFDIPLKYGQEFFIEFNNILQKEMKRFSQIYISKAFSHPKYFDITNFTDIDKHNFQEGDFRITFIWREDRLWMTNLLLQNAVNKVNIRMFRKILLTWQKRKIIFLFSKLRKKFPDAKFTVSGFGNYIKLPRWIDNQIVDSFNAEVEKKLCQIYSESRVIVGVHGSHMLLPSAHAGMTIDLMPCDRWGNFAQDILYQENDVRMSSYRYRYFPITLKADSINKIINHLISDKKHFDKNMILFTLYQYDPQ